jgi:hypothetical protein
MKLPDWLPGAAVRFALVLLLGLSPWPDLQKPFEVGFRALANLALHQLDFATEFGPAGAEIVIAVKPDQDAPSWDNRLVLTLTTATGVGHLADVFVNVRRIAYIPLLGLVSLILAAPLSRSARLRALAIGVPLTLLYSIGSLWTTSQWLFAEIPGIVRTWSLLHKMTVHLAYRTLVVPTSNRYIIPLLLAGLLIAQQKLREAALANGRLLSRGRQKAAPRTLRS